MISQTAKFQNEKKANQKESRHSISLDSLPVRITLNTNNHCNISCRVCGFSFGNQGSLWKEKSSMSSSVLNEVAEQLFETAWEIIPTTYGEPLLYKELGTLLKLINDYNCKIGLYTNGILLIKRLAEQLVPLLNDLKISFDGSSQQTYETLRCGANYTEVLKNIMEFNTIREIYSYLPPPTLTFQYTMMRSNIEELPNMIKLAANYKADRVAVSHVYIFKRSLLSESLISHQSLSDRILDESSRIGHTLGINTFFPRKFSKKNGNIASLFKKGTCSYLYKETWIDSNGDVHPCFMPGSPIMGNLYSQAFEEIWNGSLYKRMRQTVNSDTPFFSRCGKCPIRIQFDAAFKKNYEIAAFTFF